MENIIGDYIISGSSIARGSFSDVFLGHHRYTNSKVAIKRIKVRNVNKLDKIVAREIEIHSKLHHPNIIQMLDRYIDYKTKTVYLILEYCDGCSLKDYQATHYFTEADIQNFMQQIVRGLQYLYQNGVLHRDLKPQNILLDKCHNIKLIDFGLAREFNESGDMAGDMAGDDDCSAPSLFETFCGSPMYMSPEMLHRQKYETSSDLWSLGVIMFELITGHTPFHAKNFQELEKQILQPVVLPEKYISKLSNKCQNLLLRLLKTDSKDRISWSELFVHPWIISNLALQHENAIIENPLDFDLLNQMKQIPKDDSQHNKKLSQESDIPAVASPIKSQIHIFSSGLLRNYSAGVLNGLSQTPPSITPLKPPKPINTKNLISTKPVFFNSISVDSSFPIDNITSTTPATPATSSNPNHNPDHNLRIQQPRQIKIIEADNIADNIADNFADNIPQPTKETISHISLKEKHKHQQQHQQLDDSLQQDFDNIIQEYNIIPTGCDSFESESSFGLVTTLQFAELNANPTSHPIPIPNSKRAKSNSYDGEFIALQKDLKFVTPPDNTYNDTTIHTTSSGICNFWTNSLRILKDSLRDSYDYLSNNPKSL